MMRKLPPEPPSSEITPEPLYLRRREFLKNGARAAADRHRISPSNRRWSTGP
ncbi:MAG TPA: hypothetical protein VHL09_14180 [Dehalococcoidia bacterium]|nr:hypothetical protein [Dehalococcoidia bacterium]